MLFFFLRAHRAKYFNQKMRKCRDVSLVELEKIDAEKYVGVRFGSGTAENVLSKVWPACLRLSSLSPPWGRMNSPADTAKRRSLGLLIRHRIQRHSVSPRLQDSQGKTALTQLKFLGINNRY